VTRTAVTRAAGTALRWIVAGTLTWAPASPLLADAAQAHPPAPAIIVRDAWVRESTANRTVSAGYLTIENRSAREATLIGVTAAAATQAEIHTVVQKGGESRMQPAAAIVIPAHGSVTLEPGGAHIMISDITIPFVQGRTVLLTLKFADRHTQTIHAVVRPLSAVSAR
jgi:copper(I)-binding protein